MEEYKLTFKKVITPACLILLLQMSAILSADAFLFRNNQQLRGAILLCIIAAALIIKKIPDTLPFKPALNRTQNIYTALIIFFLISGGTIILTLVPYHYALSVLQDNSPMKSFVVNADVIDVKEKRYNQGISVSVHGSGQLKNITGLIITKDHLNIKKGDTISIRSGNYNKLESTPHISSFEKNLIRKKYSFTCFCRSKDIAIIRQSREGVFLQARRRLNQLITSIFSDRLSGLIKALYFGNKSTIDNRSAKAFKEAGVFHVLAASGLHAGIIACIPMILLAPFRIDKRAIALSGLILVYVYLLFTDMPVSLLRAVIMMSIFTLIYLVNFQKNIFNTLYITAIIVLTVYPWEIFNLGFQLSFGATLGIILFYQIYRKSLNNIKAPPFLIKMLAVSLSAQIVVIPIILFTLREINCIGIAANMVAIPAISLLLLLSLFTCTIAPLSNQLTSVLAWLTEFIHQKTVILIDCLASCGGHFYIQDTTPLLLIPALFILTPLLPVLHKKKYSFIFVITGYILLWPILNYSVDDIKQRCLIFNDKSERAILYYSQRDLYLMGSIKNYQFYQTIAQNIRKSHYTSLTLLIPEPNYNNLRFFSKIIEKTAVNMCYIDKGFTFAGYFQNFCRLLEKEKIALRTGHFSGSTEKFCLSMEDEKKESDLHMVIKIYTKAKNMLKIKNTWDNISINYITVGIDKR